MVRKAINDLQMNTEYVIQVRAVNKDATGEWSRKFNFTTITDQIAPKTPTGVSFIINGTSFLAQWNTVTQNVDDSVASITKYEMQLRKGSTIKNFNQPEQEGETVQERNWDYAKIQSLFGRNTQTLDFRVRAVNSAKLTSAWSAWNTASAAAGPGLPTNVVVTGVNDGLNIKWDAPADSSNIAGYRVFIGLAPNFTPSAANMIYDGQATATTYVTTTYQIHYVKVRSYDYFGRESADATGSGTPKSPFGPDTNAPSVPTSLAATLNRVGNTASANLTWNFDASGANADIQSFAIKWRKSGSSEYFVDFADKSARSLSVVLPQAYANYAFAIASVDWMGNYSAFSSEVTLSGDVPGAPPKVTGVTASTGMDSITLNWPVSTAADVVKYQVQVATDSGFTSGLISTVTGNTSITFSGLNASTTYYYRVAAIDATDQQGTYSDTASVATKAFPIPPKTDGSAPASSPTPTVTPGIGYLFVNWTAVANNDPVTYEVHISTTSGFTPNSGTKVAETPATVITLEKDAAGAVLAYGTTYYIKIIAKDADNPAAASAQASGTPSKLTNSDSALVITAADIQTGTLGASIITLGSGGQIKSLNYDATAKTGFSLTENALVIYNGTIAAETLQSNTSITANLSVTGNLTVSASGAIKSTNYSTSPGSEAGFSLSSTGLDVRSGTIAVGTLIGGTINGQTIRLGTNGKIIVDASGAIQSNNYVAGSTGWYLGPNGLDLPGLSINVGVGQISGGTFNGGNFIVGSAGSIQSSNWNGSTVGWQLGYQGLTINNGTIRGSTVITNQLYSSKTDASTPSGYAFSLGGDGDLEVSNAWIGGNTTVGAGASHLIQTSGFVQGAANGWQIKGDGTAYFNNVTVKGTVTSSSILNNMVGVYDDTIVVTSSGSRTGATITIDGTGNYQGVGTWYPAIKWSSGANLSGVGSAVHFNYMQGQNPAFSTSRSGNNSYFNLDLNGNNLIGIGGFQSGSAITINRNFVFTANNDTIQTTFTATSHLTAAPNARWQGGTGGGYLFYTSHTNSSLRYKKNIETLDIDPEKIFELRVVEYDLKAEVTDRPEGYRFVGFIAEEAEALGFDQWLEYDDEGRPDTFDYSKWVAAQQVALQYLKSENEELKAENKALRSAVESITARLDAAGI